MAINGNIPVVRSVLPPGVAGVDATVKKMAQMANGIYGAKSPKIRALAIDIVKRAGVPQKDYYGEIVAIHNYVRDNIRYVRDPVGQETLSYPEETAFNSKAGDCLDGETRLLTPHGYKAIKDVQQGDLIQGKNGWTRVINWWDKGELPTLKIMLDNGGEFIATADHRCFLTDGRELAASELQTDDTLLGPSEIELPDSSDFLTDDDFFFVGIYLADGWCEGKKTCISGKDGFAKEAQKHWVKAWAEAKGWRTNWQPRYITVYIPEEHPLFGMLHDGKLAPEKAIPDEILSKLSRGKAARLLEGLLADGYHPLRSQRAIGAEKLRKYQRRNGTCYSTTSHDLAKQARLLFRLAGFSCRDTLVVDHGGLGSHPVHRIYPRYFRDKPARVEAVVPDEIRRVYDIETEDHGIYLPDADVVVHNCDDESILEIALLGSIGIRSYPVVVGMVPNNYSHVYVHAIVPPGKHRNAGMTVPLDPIMSEWPAGREAIGVKAKKTYPELSMPSGLNGDASVLDGLQGYAVGPSYLDQNDAQVESLLVPDKRACYTHADGSVANGTRSIQGMEGIDGLMGPAVQVVRPAGGTYDATSAGDAGTVMVNAGQLVPRGFLRTDPSLNQMMFQQPASAAQLGPRGPIYMRTATEDHERLKRSKAGQVPTLSRQLNSAQPQTAPPVYTPVGQKRYEVPTLTAELKKQRGESPFTTQFLQGRKTITLKTQPKQKLGQSAMPKTLGEALVYHQALAGELGATVEQMKAQIPKQPMAGREALTQAIQKLSAQLDQVEANVLALKQALRRQPGIKRSGARSAAVRSGERAVAPSATHPTAPLVGSNPVNGLGAIDIMGTVKSPWFYGPILGVVALFAVRKFLKKKPSAASA